MSTGELAGKIAIVTGAGSGIGYAEARALAELGAHVVVNDVRTHHGRTDEEATADEVAAQFTGMGLSASADTGDIGNEEYAVGLVDRTVKSHGRIDIVVNNAGVLGDGNVFDTDTEFLARTMAINFYGAFWTQRTALRYMRDQNYGRIVHTSSGAGAFGQKDTLSYNASKMAVLALSKTGALDTQGLNIRINALCPLARSVMAREFWESRTHVDPDTVDPRVVAALVTYLVSEECELSGEVLSAGVGRWARVVIGKTAGAHGDFDGSRVANVLDEVLDVTGCKFMHSSRDQYDEGHPDAIAAGSALQRVIAEHS